MPREDETGLVFRIEKYMISDGAGIRTNVFLKGCPLRCLWCFNPEGIEKKPEILVFKNKCIQCDECIEICPTKAITIRDGYPKIDRAICDVCGECVSICPSLTLEICGTSMTVNEIVDEVRKDEVFYRRSNGGVTITGGELSAQPKFVTNLLRACKREYNTAVETCGFAPWAVLKEILELSDQVFFDVKHMDSKRHYQFTGVKNELILNNLKRASTLHHSITVRIPLVPGFNDASNNIRKTAEFVRSLKKNIKIELLPYINFGISKYEMIGATYQLSAVKSPSPDLLKDRMDIIKDYDIDCCVVN
jgi:pyruvate formate lyase activating enzyme